MMIEGFVQITAIWESFTLALLILLIDKKHQINITVKCGLIVDVVEQEREPTQKGPHQNVQSLESVKIKRSPVD